MFNFIIGKETNSLDDSTWKPVGPEPTQVLEGDKDRQLHTLWKETKIGEILPWDDIEEEAEKIYCK